MGKIRELPIQPMLDVEAVIEWLRRESRDGERGVVGILAVVLYDSEDIETVGSPMSFIERLGILEAAKCIVVQEKIEEDG